MAIRRLSIRLVAAAAVLVYNGASAHVTSLASSEVTVSGDLVRYELTVSSHDLAAVLAIPFDSSEPVPAIEFQRRRAALEKYIDQRLLVSAQAQACTASRPALEFTTPSGAAGEPASDLLRVGVAFRCPAPVTRLTVRYGLFFDTDASHNNITVVSVGERQRRFLLNASFNTIELDVARHAAVEPWTTRFGRVFVLGVQHILTGYDHLLFLLALLIVSARFWQVVKIVTAFTVAHSLTLALAWLGLIDLPSRLVESLIALSIVYVAAQNLTGRGFAHRWLLAGGLGLVHGLGFYTVLADLGLGAGHAVPTLIAFNLGVEAGQLVIVAAVFGPLTWCARQTWYRASATVASTLILFTALWWVAERALDIAGPGLP